MGALRRLGAASLLAVAACGGGATPTQPPTPAPAESPSSSAYLQNVSSQAASVCYYSTVAEPYGVEWALAAGGPALGHASEAEPRRNHLLRLAPLQPDTSYRYDLRSASGALVARATFTTAPAPGGRAVTLGYISDSGWVGGTQGQVGAAMAASSPPLDVLLHGGDVVYPSGEREGYWPRFFEPFAEVLARTALFPAIGNHDLETESGRPWNEMFSTPATNAERTSRYYSFAWGDVHVLVLDSASASIRNGSAQWAFAAEDLAAARASWKLVVLHHPPFTGGPNGPSSEVVRNLVPLFESRRVDLVFSGHDHAYQRFRPRAGVTYVVSAGGGAPQDPVRALAEHAFSRSCCHFVRVRADATALLVEAVDVSGQVFDTIGLRR